MVIVECWCRYCCHRFFSQGTHRNGHHTAVGFRGWYVKGSWSRCFCCLGDHRIHPKPGDWVICFCFVRPCTTSFNRTYLVQTCLPFTKSVFQFCGRKYRHIDSDSESTEATCCILPCGNVCRLVDTLNYTPQEGMVEGLSLSFTTTTAVGTSNNMRISRGFTR